jgi:hypothetical protein
LEVELSMSRTSNGQIQVAGERHRRDTLSIPGRWWGRLQDLTVGYGYRPVRAGAWLAVLFTGGTVVFTLHPPRAADPGTAPDFVPPVYTLDLILPVGDFGQLVHPAARRSGWPAR